MSRQNNLTGLVIAAVVLTMVMIMAGCSGKGSSGSTATQQATGASFNIKGASQLVALSNTVSPTSTTSASQKLWNKVSGKKAKPFEYKIVNQGLSNDEVKARAKGKKSVNVSQAAASPAEMGTNLLAIDATGNAGLAIDSTYLIKVMYSVTDPKGEYVYLALDTGFANPDGNDYTPFISKNNCALYRVSIADNSAACVQEGVYVQSIDESYQQRVSSNQKPIQFDAKGNMYFPGTKFNAKCDDKGTCTMFVAQWNPRIYRVDAASQVVTALTQDNQKISFYLTMPTGELAYQTIAEDGSIILYLWQPSLSTYIINGTTTNLTGNATAIDFFTVDNYNTIMWGGAADSAIRFAKPGSGGLVQKATLDTSILAPQDGMIFNYAPRRISVGDDGKLYALFNHVSDEPQLDNTSKYFRVSRIYQVLPYSAVIKAEMKVETNEQAIYSEMFGTSGSTGSQTPFQIGGGFLFYKETREKIGYGVNDVIQMVSLKDRSLTTLLGGTNDWWEIYSWRLKGDRLFFAALDLSTTTVYSGEIDIAYVKSNPLANPDLFVFKRAVASAVGASAKVQDIEGLSPLPVFAGATNPIVNKIHQSSENLYSASVEFSNLMDQATAENNIGMTEVDGAGNFVSKVATLKLWIANYLHLIPDLDVNNATTPLRDDDALLDLKHTTPLSFQKNYKIAVTTTGVNAAGSTVVTKDVAGTPLASSSTVTLQTRPEFGWYISSDTTGLSSYIGKYAGGDSADHYDEIYALNTNGTGTTVPRNFRVEFVAANQGSRGLRIVLYDDTNDGLYRFYHPRIGTTMNSSIWMSVGIDPWSSSWWMNSDNLWLPPNHELGWQYMYNRDNLIFNGDSKRYRLDLYGNQIRLYRENPPGSGTMELTTFEYSNPTTGMRTTSNDWSLFSVLDRPANHIYKLFLRTWSDSPLSIDNFTVTELDATGAVVGGAIETIDFETGTMPAGAKYSNVPNFTTRIVSSGTGTTFCDTNDCPNLTQDW